MTLENRFELDPTAKHRLLLDFVKNNYPTDAGEAFGALGEYFETEAEVVAGLQSLAASGVKEEDGVYVM